MMQNTQQKLWKCDVCGYVHRGAEPPETCPVCGVSSEHFSEMKPVIPTAEQQAESYRCTICDYIHRGSVIPQKCPVCGAGRGLFEPVSDAVANVSAMRKKTGHVVIIGAGIAGVTAAEYARQYAPEATISLISNEPDMPYYRLNLTRFLAGEVSSQELTLVDEQWFDTQRISYYPGEVSAIEPSHQKVQLRDASCLEYDSLIIAQGAHPFVPPIPGVTRRGVTPLRSLQHAEWILKTAQKGAAITVIGGGLLGLEAAAALVRHGGAVTVIEGYTHILPRQLTPRGGAIVRAEVEQMGIACVLGKGVKLIDGDERVRQVILEDGEQIPADIVVVATGVRPNTYLARQAGLKVMRGILVDDAMSTSEKAVFAAGDCAEHRGMVYGIWPAAYSQGMVAGINALGGGSEFKGIAHATRIKVLNVDLFSVGRLSPQDASEKLLEAEDAQGYSSMLIKDGRVIGANLIGDTDHATLLKEAVEQQTPFRANVALQDAFPTFTRKINE